MRRLTPLCVIAFLSVATLLGCGKAEVGERCSQKGSTSECVDGAICDTEKDTVICLKSCRDDAECTSTQSCTGVSGGTGKACHAK